MVPSIHYALVGAGKGLQQITMGAHVSWESSVCPLPPPPENMSIKWSQDLVRGTVFSHCVILFAVHLRAGSASCAPTKLQTDIGLVAFTSVESVAAASGIGRETSCQESPGFKWDGGFGGRNKLPIPSIHDKRRGQDGMSRGLADWARHGKTRLGVKVVGWGLGPNRIIQGDPVSPKARSADS